MNYKNVFLTKFNGLMLFTLPAVTLYSPWDYLTLYELLRIFHVFFSFFLILFFSYYYFTIDFY